MAKPSAHLEPVEHVRTPAPHEERRSRQCETERGAPRHHGSRAARRARRRPA